MNVWWSDLFLAGYFLLYGVAVGGLMLWRKRSRRERKPFADEQKLLRGPGESLRRRVNELDENLDLWLCVGSLLPLLAGPGLFALVMAVDESAGVVAIVLGSVGLLTGFILSARWVMCRLAERQNRYLGYFGERVVAESLEPLKLRGWRIFHDVPCDEAAGAPNIDHVAVGPGGVFAVETKTRRKGPARAGQPDYKVISDGERLIWPWGEDRHGLKQAHQRALWLSQWLEGLLGRPVAVQPILALPGWWVERSGRGIVQVLNAKELPVALTPRPGAEAPLSGDEIELVARQLDARCRDVEY
jgi:hypothetical protein